MDLGMSLDSVLATEPDSAYTDLLGATCQYDVPGGELYVQYFVNRSEGNAVKAVDANLRFRDPVKAANLYDACRDFFNQRYGLPYQTAYGNESWQQAQAEGILEVHLRLFEPQASLTVNFVQVKP